MADPLGSPAYVAPAALLAGVMLWLVLTYALTLFLLDRGIGAHRWALWICLGGALLFQSTLLFLPGLLSQDVFSYIAYGRVAALYDLNPYIWPPSVLRDPVVEWVAGVWRTYPTPYGPLWVSIQWLLARAGQGLSISDQALVYRAFANGVLLVNLALAWRLLGRMTPLNRTQRTTAFVALAWNPLLLFEIAANAHNDALMITLSLAALLLFAPNSRGLWSTVALSLATLVKYLSGPGLIWLALASAARAQTWPRRIVRVLVLAFISVTIALVIAAPWLELPDSLDPIITETARVGFVNSLPDNLVLMVVDHRPANIDQARAMERLVVLALFAGYLLWEVRQVCTDPSRGMVARALARSTLIYVLLVSTSVQTWYFCLPITLALTLGWRTRIARLALAYGALALPALYVSYYLRDLTPGWVYLAYAGVPLLALAPDLLATRARARAHVPPAIGIGDDEQATHGHRGSRAVMEKAHR